MKRSLATFLEENDKLRQELKEFTNSWTNLIILERQLQAQYNQVLHQEKMLWYQKSREKWIKFDNKNTKFFPYSSCY